VRRLVALESAMRLTALFPHLAGLRLAGLTATACQLALDLQPTARGARCPLCHRHSRRVRGTYVRTLVDLPCAGLPVTLRVCVRRFACANPCCPRRIFAERLPALALPYARQTELRRAALQRIGMALGGNPGKRLALALGLPTSRATLLRLVRAAPITAATTPHAVGIDEWAWRRGDRYGTIIVDLVAHRPLALLPDRNAAVTAAWLCAQPAITVACRDRSGLYADAIAAGAPTAVQVADRWHLLKNLGDALERFLLRKSASLKAAAAAMAPEEPLLTTEEAMYRGKHRSPHDHERRMEEASLQRHARRVAAYERMHALHAAGADIADIARTLGASHRTVYRYLAMPEAPERKRPAPRRKVLDPSLPYLLERWDEGCHNGMRLWREIRAMGFAHSSTNVARFVSGLRRGLPRPRAHRSAVTRAGGPSARQGALLLLSRPDHLDDEQRTYLAHLCQSDAEIAAAYTRTQQFAMMVRERQGEGLDRWIAATTDDAVAEVRGFAQGLRGDLAAVRAGLSLPWSNGQTEGQINRLKLLKRQMYGRAKVDLLQQRLLYRP
jgi:transposase